MRRLLLFLFLLLIPACAYGQTNIASGPVNPAFCNPGAYFYNTTNSVYLQCAPGNIWAVTGGSVGGGITNFVYTAVNSTTGLFAPVGIPIGNGGSAVTTCPYTVQQDTSLATVDRATVIEFNSSSPCAVTLPDTGSTGMTGNFTVRFRNVGAGAVTVSRGTSATFSVATGSLTGSGSGSTSFALTQWQYATCYGDNVSVWRCDATTSGAGTDQVFTGPNPYIDIRAYGARAYASGAVPTATATCTNGSPNVSLSAASTFQNGDYVAIYGCGTSTANTPSAPTVTPIKAASQTMTLYDVNDAGGGTQYCYQILSRTLLGGTSVSTETCTATGSATLGLQTTSITSVALANNIATYTTSAHTLVVGSMIRIVNVTTLEIQTGTVQPAFNGWFTVATVPDNTHFTVYLNADTRNGAIAVGTGGTVNYWAGNKITATATTNNYEYYIYGRVTGGTKTLIGVMQPQPFGTTCAALFTFADTTCLTFDDFGTGVLTAAPTVPSYIPNVVPAAGTKNDMLLTKIVSGAGTTNLVVANNAGNSISGTIYFDCAQALKAAVNAAATPGTSGSVLIPSSGDLNKAFQFYAPIQLIQQGGVNVSIQQSADIWLWEPIVFSTPVQWTGIPGGTQANNAFSLNIAPVIYPRSASPGMYMTGGYKILMIGTIITVETGNSGVGYLQDGGGIPANYFKSVSWNIFGHSEIAAVFRGSSGADFQFINNTVAGTQNNAYTDTTPGMHFNQLVNVKFDWLFLSGNGISIFPNGQGAGGYLFANDVYCQACYMPFFMLAEGIGGGPTWARLSNISNDTGFDNFVITNVNAGPLFLSGDGGLSSAWLVGNGSSTGAPVNFVDSYGYPFAVKKLPGANGTSDRGGRYAARDGTFGANNLAIDYLNRSMQIGQGFSLFTGTGSYTVPTCVVSAGGSLPVGPIVIMYAPVFSATGSEGTLSQYCTATTSGGNQTVTATLPATIPGAATSNWYEGTSVGSMSLCSTNGSSIVITATCNTANGATTGAAGGPAGINKNTVWGQNVWAGNSNISSNATAARAVTFSDSAGTVLLTGSDANSLLQTKRVSGCATAASLNATCDTTVTWTNPFADANYTVSCIGSAVTSGVPIIEGISISAAKTASAITVRTISITAAAAQFTNLNCMAVHD